MRGLKLAAGTVAAKHLGRIPYGMRGLKSDLRFCGDDLVRSHPIRDAWIEINHIAETKTNKASRIPYGMRGLKSSRTSPKSTRSSSHPIRDAWIEINNR